MNRDYVLDRLLNILWARYKIRVTYAAQYEDMVKKRGGKVQNDHVAFRTFNCKTGSQPAGVVAVARIFEALGYQKKDQYIFTDKKLTAWHWEHKTNPANPKIFISQLEVDQLSPVTGAIIAKIVENTPDLISESDQKLLHDVCQGKDVPQKHIDAFVDRLAAFFVRPWGPPLRKNVEVINNASQYAAWTLLHGNSVNHFTAYINEQHVAEWPDLEATVDALRQAGLPMKDEFEGERGSKLRQSSTQAAEDECDVIEDSGDVGKMKWSYAYYELAERGNVVGPDGKPVRFHAFLGEQATNLFEMTKRN